jgi:hypothetical protein
METAKVRDQLNSHLALSLTNRTLQQAVNYVAETIQGTGAEASKEANKNVAKSNDANVSTRASAAKDALSDKKDEFSHNTKADVHKGKPNH